jgi:coenzyme F420-reducing hydrogenase delta subunit
LAGIEIPHLTIAGLRAKVEAVARNFRGGPRILVFGCDHGADVAKLAAPGVATVSLPCTGMLPPPFVDFVLSRDLADGVVLTGCRSAHCRARLGVRWTEERIEGRRDPALRARVPRERLALVWASPSDMGALRAGLSAFAARLESLAGPPAAAPERTDERRAAGAAGERA